MESRARVLHRKMTTKDCSNQVWALLDEVVWRLDHLSLEPPLTTASPTPTADTEGSPLVAAKASTSQRTAASLPLDPPGTLSGPAVPGSGCVHRVDWLTPVWNYPETGRLNIRCRCGARWWCVEIAAPAAAPTSSTSVKQPLNSSASPLNRESEPSPWNALTSGWWSNGYTIGDHDAGPSHWHSQHSHEGGDRWHQH